MTECLKRTTIMVNGVEVHACFKIDVFFAETFAFGRISVIQVKSSGLFASPCRGLRPQQWLIYPIDRQIIYLPITKEISHLFLSHG